jgi:hypothetical protein
MQGEVLNMKELTSSALEGRENTECLVSLCHNLSRLFMTQF